MGKKYNTIPDYIVARSKNEKDGYFRFIYIQINLVTGEYYIGKVNRPKYSEIKKYQGSGLKFVNKYNNHKEEFKRYYLFNCKTAKETEIIEASIVNDELLKDELCLNLVKGGGGTNNHNNDLKSKRQSEYMIAHPEQYQPFIEKNKELFQSGDSDALRRRNTAIKKRMNSEKYKKMTSIRIKKWKNEHPDAYETARKNNKMSVQSKKAQEKRLITLNNNIINNPEKYKEGKQKRISALHSPSARIKAKESIKKWYQNNPEKAKVYIANRSKASVEKNSKKVAMLDIDNGKVLRIFKSQKEAARWLVENGKAKNINCATSISEVCRKKKCYSGYGYRKMTHGYGWKFI